MVVIPEDKVRVKLAKFIRQHGTATAAAKAAGCTRAEMSIAVQGGRIPAKVLSALKVKKVEVYTYD